MSSPVTSAHQYIRKRILSGEFAPGDALAAKHLAEMIGVSRTPVRDALRQLETEGLVEINPRQEARVKKAGIQDLRDIWELRIALETHAAALAAQRHSDEDIERLEDLLYTMRQAIDAIDSAEGDDERWQCHQQLAQSDIRFHLAIMEASRNQLISAEVDRFRVIHDIVLPLGKRPSHSRNIKSRADNVEIWQSHKAIFDALRNRDEMATYLAMKEHLTTPMQRTMRVMREQMETASVRVPELI
jgi:DNA-binding GntR family transcriptional regulator